MSDAEDDDKQFEPTQKKLDDARKKGEIAKSNDLITAAAYGGFLIVAMGMGSALLVGFASSLMGLLAEADALGRMTFAGSQNPLMGGVLLTTAAQAGPWFAGPAILAILALIAQRGLVFAPSKLAPKMSRISPISGAKNKFGRAGLFEFAKSTTKLLIYGVVLGVFLSFQMPRMIGAMHLTPAMVAVTLGQLVVSLLLIVLVIAAVLGIVDFLWQRAEHLRKHRMSRKEMMDETKQSEGDPMMKQQRRQRAFDIAMNQMLVDVPAADVVIVNPQHYAVALAWSRMPGTAPKCVAKGVDEVAARIREIAMEHGVPIHADPPTARALHATVAIGEEIAITHFKPVAAAIRFAEKVRQQARKRR
ncbi:flagellar biosynthetic protein FlhB [Cognatiyoonia koreensis]|uniref:Flagellar biosynthetic protein FlhB n=1 Tax=Cognatiyoonia koreensis TaxID=364200 RepID=A0A1I0RJX1_9RHOB|nr:flagellar type III secretion system protein FlhB [Cognatiyoonia koreensis]SEW41305.1 flagellar biosynthetic protein FlhB [Cognatiyoonia koreensis]